MSNSKSLTYAAACEIDREMNDAYNMNTRDMNLLAETERREAEGAEPMCAAALCKHDFDNDSTHYALIETSKGSSDYKEMRRLCYGNDEAEAFITEHADLWSEPVERKPMINKQGRFSRTPAKDNQWVGAVRTTPIKRSNTASVVWMPIKSEDQFFVLHAQMGHLRDAKLTKWGNKVIQAIQEGKIQDGKWLYTHVAGVQGKAPYGLKGRTYELVSQIWFCWKTRKATLAVVAALRQLGK